MDLTTFLSSSVVSALVAALVALRSNERKIHVENVTQERAKWRKAMRELADAIVKAARTENSQQLELHCAQLALNLNPFDSEDQALVQAAKSLTAIENRDVQVQQFTDRMALLLKHDWERAKREAQPWFFRKKEPRRVPYLEYDSQESSTPVNAPASPRPVALVGYFATLSLAAGIIFFLAVGLAEPFHDLVKLFNDPKTEKPASAWLQFGLMSAITGALWSTAYLWFKASEKRFLEIWYKK